MKFETLPVQSRRHEGQEYGRGTNQWNYLDSKPVGQVHRPGARISNSGAPGLRHQSDISSLQGRCQQLFDLTSVRYACQVLQNGYPQSPSRFLRH